jgi:hypothetical protein
VRHIDMPMTQEKIWNLIQGGLSHEKRTA